VVDGQSAVERTTAVPTEVRLTRPRQPTPATLALHWADLYTDNAAKADLRDQGFETVGDVARLTLAELSFYGVAQDGIYRAPKIRRRGLLSILAVLSELGVALADGTFLRMPVGTHIGGLHSVPSGARNS
jgi:hypothetical protein